MNPASLFSYESICNNCGGDGKVDDGPCAVCDGTGVVIRDRRRADRPTGVISEEFWMLRNSIAVQYAEKLEALAEVSRLRAIIAAQKEVLEEADHSYGGG